MDTQSVDKALAAVRQRVEHDKAEAAMTAARAEETRRATERKESLYRLVLDDVRRQALGKSLRPIPATLEDYQQFLIHRERGMC